MAGLIIHRDAARMQRESTIPKTRTAAGPFALTMNYVKLRPANLSEREKRVSVLAKLATALNRRDEVPNQELARKIVRERDAAAVKELVENLGNKTKGIPGDCIKTLYEIGASNPDLIAKYYKEFGKLLESKNNRMVWGAMTTLDTIALKEPKGVRGMLSKILDAADNSGSVIARDHAVGILAKLGTVQPYKRDCVPLLLEQLMSCPNNQFAMYVEKSVAVIDAGNSKRFQQVMEQRMPKLERESQKKRVAKVLKKLAQYKPQMNTDKHR
jgi:hypothetical protein